LRRRLRHLPAIAVLAAGLTALATVPAQAATATVAPSAPFTAAEGDFYAPPATLPTHNGDVIRHQNSRVITDPLTNSAPPATAQRIMYRSTDTHGVPIAVTGTVFSPTTAWQGPGKRPLVSYAVGTQGQGDQCAPSHLFNQGLEYETLFISQVLAKGAAVVVTDYEGLGTPGVHTYMNRLSQAHAVLDAARAAQRLSNDAIPADGLVGLYGYSQGGGATAAAAELQPTYAPELKVVGSAIGAPPADLSAVAGSVDGTTIGGVIGYTINGLVASYPELAAVRSLLNQQGNDMLDMVKYECIGETTLRFGLQPTSSYTKTSQPVSSFLGQEPYKSIVDSQRIGRLRPTAPVYIWQGLNDDVIPFAQSRQLAVDWCGKGSTVQFNELPIPAAVPKSSVGHVLPMMLGGGDAMAWLYQRFANATPAAPAASGAPSNCGSLPSASGVA
jgi:Secretory lipase